MSLAISSNMILTGGSAGSLYLWKRDTNKEIKLQKPNPNKGNDEPAMVNASVVESIKIVDDFILAGTKDGYIFVLGKSF